MIKIKNSLKKEEEYQLIYSLSNCKLNDRDFYFTVNKERLFIKNEIQLLIKKLKNGDKIIYDEEFKNIALVTGISDKKYYKSLNLPSRKYLKVLYKDIPSAENLLRVLFWNYNEEIFAKFKRQNPLVHLLIDRFQFRFFGNRGKEILLKRSKRYDRKQSDKFNQNRSRRVSL